MTKWAAAGLVVVVMLGGSRADAADPPAAPAQLAEARSHFTRGVKFYQDADYRSALVEFQEAYRVAPNPRLLFNIGQTYEELQDFAGAVTALREYLAQSGTSITTARRAEVEKDLRRLEGHVATVDVTVNEADADVVVEGDRRVELGKSPLAAAVLLNGGSWTIAATKAGFERAEERVTAAGGDRKKIALILVPKKAVAAAPAPSAEPASPPGAEPAPPPRALTRAYVALGVTGALAVGAGVTGALTLGAQSDYDRAVAQVPGNADDVSRARSRTRTLALTTDVLAGAAIAGAVTTVVLYLTSRPKAAAHAAGAATGNAAAGLRVQPYVGPGAIGATGSF
jgi:hypothetical protein